MKWAQKQTGFTIVELLIVVVVIAILATITVVAYNGITQNARISTAKSDLSNLNKALQILASDGANFTQAATWNKALHQSGLYDSTQDTPVGTKSFVLCGTADRYAVGVSRPLNLPQIDGSLAHYVHVDTGLQTLSWDTSTSGSTTLIRFCSQILPEATFRVWSFDASVRDV